MLNNEVYKNFDLIFVLQPAEILLAQEKKNEAKDNVYTLYF